MVLEPPESVRKLQMALQAKAKGAPSYRFYLLPGLAIAARLPDQAAFRSGLLPAFEPDRTVMGRHAQSCHAQQIGDVPLFVEH